MYRRTVSLPAERFEINPQLKIFSEISILIIRIVLSRIYNR
jgi:hypothetical protein